MIHVTCLPERQISAPCIPTQCYLQQKGHQIQETFYLNMYVVINESVVSEQVRIKGKRYFPHQN